MSWRAAIRGIRFAVPTTKLTNEQLTQEFPDWDVDKIFRKTGIAQRAITQENECASDLGVSAALELFDAGVCSPDDIEFLLFCTQSPDYPLPTTACMMQHRLGLPETCGALDFNLGCSGFVYGLALAKSLIETRLVENVLLITAETYSKYLHPEDRSARTIFGDGAAATLVAGVDAEKDLIGPFVFGTDGSGARNLIVAGGGMRQPLSEEIENLPQVSRNVPRSPHNLYMNGPEIFNFTLNTVPVAVKSLLTKCELKLDEIDYFVFHQASSFILERLRSKIAIPKDKFFNDIEMYGNTVSASLPIALEIARENGQILNGERVMVVGFGVGYSWAATLITFT